jgi:transcriptional regulator with XRE-family HTH domain
MYGWDFRSARREAGLTLSQVARAAGTAETNVSAYERGSKRPCAATARRLKVAIAAGRASPIHRNSLLTLPAAAAALRVGLRHGWPTADLLRLVREMVSNSKWVDSAEDIEAFFAQPSTTGDQRWDAMLAGVAEHLSLRAGREAPAWTAGHALRPLWFVGSVPGLDSMALANSAPSLRVRGVVIDQESLTSV